MPYENPPDYREEVRQKAQLRGCTRKVGEVNWLISWGVWAEVKVIAHVNLAGSRFEAQQHRGTLSLGAGRAHQGYGLATELLTTAVERARNEALKWVDLRVFSHNERAISLYEKFGFKEVGRFADYFRIKGQQIDAVSMTRKLHDSMPLTPAEAQTMRRTA